MGGGGLLFEMNAANIEIGFYKTIGLMERDYFVKVATILKKRSLFEMGFFSRKLLQTQEGGFFSRWVSSRENVCKLKRGASFRDGFLLEIKPTGFLFEVLRLLFLFIWTL